ncbi:hypothetical protein EPN83_01385 [Patescibacteria group bacterium]|nr:MAG: hypothetical protein EPN83_01385 [Patescibacteria group bacterium]
MSELPAVSLRYLKKLLNSMNRALLVILIIVFLAAVFLVFLKFSSETQNIAVYKDLIRVFSPVTGSKLASPVSISGEARGFWYFEASFPVVLFDARGNEIARGIATAQGDWMTENYVPFVAELTFLKPNTKTGTLSLEKDNLSGLLEHADAFRIPVTF